MKSRRSTQGFTLIEILVVLFIISIVTSVALLSISRNQNKQLESFTNELTQIVSLAEEQAMLQPIVLGLSLHGQTFQFATLKNDVTADKKNKWTLFQDTILGKQAIPEDIQVGVEVGNQLASSDEADKTNPQIIISTNGDITPFTIYIGKRGEKPRYMITGDADGNVSNKVLS
ncbi:MAG: type II secretion system minor pseudopilin GspH [Gammaproteobacteria bacterium]